MQTNFVFTSRSAALLNPNGRTTTTMLTAIKSGASTRIAKLFLGLLALTFIGWGGSGFLQDSLNEPSVAITVAGNEISQDQLTRQTAAVGRQFAQILDQKFQTVQDIKDQGLDQTVINMFVNNFVWEHELDNLNLFASRGELKSVIQSDDDYKGADGSFSPVLFQQKIVVERGMTEQAFLEDLAGRIAQSRLRSAISGADKVPQTMVEPLYKIRNQERVFELFKVPAPDYKEMEVSEDEMVTFLEENQNRFRTREYRDISFISVNPAKLAEDIAVTDEDVAKAFEERKDNLAIAEKREVEQFVLEDKETADKAFERLQAGEDFNAVSLEFTSGPPVLIGDRERRQIDVEIGDVAFELAEPGYGAPLETDFGWHIVNVKKITPAFVPTLENSKDKLITALKEEQSANVAISLSGKLDNAIGEGQTLEEASDTLGIDITQAAAVNQYGRDQDNKKVEGLPSDTKLFWQTVAALPLKEESFLIEAENNEFFVARVNQVIPPRDQTIEEVRDRIKSALQLQKARDLAHENAKSLVAELDGGKTAAELATSLETEVVTSTAATTVSIRQQETDARHLPQEAFTVAANTWSVAEAGRDAIVYRATEVIPANLDAETIKAEDSPYQIVSSEIKEALGREILTQFQAALKERTPIDIEQDIVDEAFDAAAQQLASLTTTSTTPEVNAQ